MLKFKLQHFFGMDNYVADIVNNAVHEVLLRDLEKVLLQLLF